MFGAVCNFRSNQEFEIWSFRIEVLDCSSHSQVNVKHIGVLAPCVRMGYFECNALIIFS